VNSNTRRVLQLTISLVLYGLLSGCQIVSEAAIWAPIYATPRPDPEPWMTGKNQYEPVILTSTENAIRIKYLNVGPYAEHDQVIQLISDHCDGTYMETNRVELRGYTTVDAECTHGTESSQ